MNNQDNEVEVIKQEVVIYSTPQCTYCVKAKEFFKKNGIEYREVDVKSDIEQRKQMVELSGQMGVPVILFKGNVMAGFHEDMLTEMLDK